MAGVPSRGPVPSNPSIAASRKPASSMPARKKAGTAEFQRRLDHFHLLCSVSGAKKEAFAIGAGNGVKGGLGRLKQFLFRTRSVAAHGLFDLAPHRLDGVEVRPRRRVRDLPPQTWQTVLASVFPCTVRTIFVVGLGIPPRGPEATQCLFFRHNDLNGGAVLRAEMSPVTLNRFQALAFGLRNKGVAEQQAQDADTSVNPESVGGARGVDQ